MRAFFTFNLTQRRANEWTAGCRCRCNVEWGTNEWEWKENKEPNSCFHSLRLLHYNSALWFLFISNTTFSISCPLLLVVYWWCGFINGSFTMEWRMNEWKRNEAWNEPINKNTHQKTHQRPTPPTEPVLLCSFLLSLLSRFITFHSIPLKRSERRKTKGERLDQDMKWMKRTHDNEVREANGSVRGSFLFISALGISWLLLCLVFSSFIPFPLLFIQLNSCASLSFAYNLIE